jgi:hypothetical protein
MSGRVKSGALSPTLMWFVLETVSLIEKERDSCING